MSRRLLIMRHAKSSWDQPTLSDFQRPLANKGLRDAPRMGSWLFAQQQIPDHIVSSPAQRARQTTLMVCESLGVEEEKITWNPAIYNADLDDLLAVLASVPAQSNLTLLVGHNPGLEFLFTFLWGRSHDTGWKIEGSGDAELIKTATMVLLNLPEDWSRLTPGCGSVLWIKHPKEVMNEGQE
ncbi:MAG: histidine phosphatase family protein [Magnetococcales bacterium]|nr:histidine phosphatase family protein [Magnetococcales bacterium]MBF0347419.1 histidine phosphatase family protein [Magnetococcales bacterium]